MPADRGSGAGRGRRWPPSASAGCRATPSSPSAAPSPLWWQAAAEYLANAVEIPSPTTDRLCAAARRAGIDVVIGIARARRPVPRARPTARCSSSAARARSSAGTASSSRRQRAGGLGRGRRLGLVVHERPYGRISGLNCWEHNMVLPGYALMAQGTQIHVAAWPGRSPSPRPPPPNSIWARQTPPLAGLRLAGCRPTSSSPPGLRAARGHARSATASWPPIDYTGDSCIIDPRGEVIAGPVRGETILTRGLAGSRLRRQGRLRRRRPLLPARYPPTAGQPAPPGAADSARERGGGGQRRVERVRERHAVCRFRAK